MKMEIWDLKIITIPAVTRVAQHWRQEPELLGILLVLSSLGQPAAFCHLEHFACYQQSETEHYRC